MNRPIHKYGDNINTDLIIASRYLTQFLSEGDLAKHALENLDPQFASKVRPGDVLVAGTNFGCGSSREEAVQVMAGCGLYAIIAESFSRTFFRNCINRGALIVIECLGISKAAANADSLSVDLDNGQIIMSNGQILNFQPQPAFIAEIIQAGGLLERIAASKAEKRVESCMP